MKKTKKQREKQKEKQFGLLLSYQEAARSLGLTKKDVRAMVDEGLLREVHAGGKCLITARSISHTLGYDPFGHAPLVLGGKYTDLTFEQYALRALNRGIKKAHSRTTENYRNALKLAADGLGRMKIAEIREEDLRRAFRNLESKYAKSSLHLVYTITRCILRMAYEAGDIPDDPTRRWEMPKSTKPQRSEAGRIYTEAEIAEIFRTSKEFNQELYTMFAVLECTGMRPGEMLGLEWSSYDRKSKTLHVYQAVTRQFGTIRQLDKAAKSKSILSVPKSEYSVRTLCLSDTAVEALNAWHTELRKHKKRIKSHSRFIFPGSRGRFRSLSGAEKLLQQYRAAYHIQGVTFYKFRHTMCTRLALDRQPISVIQHVMGDNSSNMINRVYTHINGADALRAMEDYFAAQSAGTAENEV